MGLTYKQARIAMQSYFNDIINGSYQVIWGNDDPTSPPDNDIFLVFNILNSGNKYSSIGAPNNNIHRQIGVITIQLFAPEGNYAVDATGYISGLLGYYSGKEINDILYYDAFIRQVGNDGNGKYQVNLICTFEYDYIA